MNKKKVQLPISKSAMMMRNMYDLYAKMLAVENIQVVFDEAIDAPAQFDILNRVLYIAPVHATQVELIPGLVIHEVGHALFSILPPEDAKKLKRISKLLNIIDDGYQERMTCKKYANAKKHLFTIFDHFFLKQKDDVYNTPNVLVNIVNTLNFNCKGFKHGHYKKYPGIVTDDDLKLLRQAEMIAEPSLLKRDEFAKELAEALKKYGDMDDDGMDLNQQGKGQGDGDSEPQEGGGESGEAGEKGEESEEGEGSSGKKKASGGHAEDMVEQILSENEDLLNDHHKKFEQKTGGSTTYELPDMDELLSFARVVDILEKDSPITKAIESAPLDLIDKYKNCQKEAKKIATRIFTKFNQRLQAQNYAHTQYKRSGVLDPERAALFQVYDDVFMKESIEPNQANNAYSVVLDWSGSMSSSVYALMLRVMELTYFARMANVEIEVWCYTTDEGAKKPPPCKKNVAFMGSRMIKILNTKKNNQLEIESRLKHFWYITRNIVGMTPKLPGMDGYCSKYALSGTNILEGLILGHGLLTRMDAEKKACFLLSDGDDSSCFDRFYKASSGVVKATWNDGRVLVHGMDVTKAFPASNVRQSSKAAIADIYRGVGQRTVGVAWNCKGAQMEEYSDNVIQARSFGQAVIDGYVAAENVFVDEIVKNLL